MTFLVRRCGIASWLVATMLATACTRDRSEVPQPPSATAHSDLQRLSEVRARLDARGDDLSQLAELAHGASVASREHIHEVAPELRGALRRLAERDDASVVRDELAEAAWLASLAVLDALIQVNALVDPDELRPFFDFDRAPAVLVLLSRQPQAGGGVLHELLDAAAEDADLRWIAAGNLLAMNPTPGFAAAVLGRLRIEVVFEVVSPSTRRGGLGRGGRHGRCFGGMDVPAGFPPIVVHVLHDDGAPPGSVVLLAEGRRPILVERILIRSDRDWPCRTSEVPNPDEVRLGWLADLVDLERVALEPRRIRIVWRSDETRAEMQDAFDRLDTDWASLRDDLALRGLLTPAEAKAATSPIHVTVIDLRVDDPRPMSLPASWDYDARKDAP